MERIKLFKGDDTDFNESEFLIIRLDTNASLEGFKASFRLGSFVQDFADITSKTLKIVIPHATTKQFPVGNLNGTLRLEDSLGRYQTITNTIPSPHHLQHSLSPVIDNHSNRHETVSH